LPSLRSAVALRLREKRGRLAQDLVRAFQFEVLTFELLQPVAFVGRQPRPLAGIALRLAHPSAQRLDATSQLFRQLIELPPTAKGGRRRDREPSGLRPHAAPVPN